MQLLNAHQAATLLIEGKEQDRTPREQADHDSLVGEIISAYREGIDLERLRFNEMVVQAAKDGKDCVYYKPAGHHPSPIAEAFCRVIGAEASKAGFNVLTSCSGQVTASFSLWNLYVGEELGEAMLLMGLTASGEPLESTT